MSVGSVSSEIDSLPLNEGITASGLELRFATGFAGYAVVPVFLDLR